jgi:hypothetical protein
MKTIFINILALCVSTVGLSQNLSRPVYTGIHSIPNGVGNPTQVSLYVITEHSNGGFIETLINSQTPPPLPPISSDKALLNLIKEASYLAHIQCYEIGYIGSSWEPESLNIHYSKEKNCYVGTFEGSVLSNKFSGRLLVSIPIKINLGGDVIITQPTAANNNTGSLVVTFGILNMVMWGGFWSALYYLTTN